MGRSRDNPSAVNCQSKGAVRDDEPNIPSIMPPVQRIWIILSRGYCLDVEVKVKLEITLNELRTSVGR